MATDAPEILHESTGLVIKRNVKNRFVVVTLRYFADPDKRSAAWVDTVRAGMTEAQFNKEYNIDYTAQFGERTFPEFIEKKDLIVIPARESWDGPVWGGFDYGERNPSSFHVYTYDDGAFIAIWELYKPCKNIVEFAAEIKSCPYYSRLRYIAADPTMWGNRTHNAAMQADNVANLFVKCGVTKFIQGNQDEAAWIANVRKLWHEDDPAFKITDNCHNLIREFEQCVFRDYNSDKTREISNLQEKIVDKQNHGLDDNKYFFNSQPTAPQGVRKKSRQDVANKLYGWDHQGKRGESIGGSMPSGFGLGHVRHPREKEFGDSQLGWKIGKF